MIREKRLRSLRATSFKLMQSKKRRVRCEAFQALYGTYQKLENTFASALNAGVKRDIFYASVRRHQSARSAALFADNIPPAVYDSLVQTVRSNLGEMHRYMELRKKILGLDELHMYDIYVPLAEDVKWGDTLPRGCSHAEKRSRGYGGFLCRNPVKGTGFQMGGSL